MHRTKTIIISVIILVFVINVDAREKDLLFSAGAGISYVTIHDNNFSVMSYTGITGLASLSITTETSAYIDELSLFFGKGKLNMDVSSGTARPNTALTAGAIDYTYVRKLKNKTNTHRQFFPGGKFSSSVGFYKRNYYGDNFYYCYQSSIGPALIVHQSIGEKCRWQVSSQVDFSIAAYIVYPAYGSSMPENLLDKELSGITAWDYMAGGEMVTLNRFQRITCKTGISYALCKKLSLMLLYSWDFHHLKHGDDMIQAMHNACFSLILH
ncbi:MAG: hypothetical protein JXK95_02935 [Bacteroidales bacterium]|nr:hypothetical protein [Bacteroidales bacterium]